MSEDSGTEAMTGSAPTPENDAARTETQKPLTPAAQRALTEAEQRRRGAAASQPTELNGRGGLEPVRYGDWEVKGLASDF